MSYIKINDVVFKYPNNYVAVENLNLEIAQGERVAIIGENGAGKTTTSKLLNGLLKPTSGYVKIGQKDMKDYTTAQVSKTVGYVFQNPDDQIFQNIVYDEIAFGPRRFGKQKHWSKQEISANVKKAIELTKLEAYINEHPYNLPYSMRKFITIASIIAMDPKIIIFDEPTAGQDSQAIALLEQIVAYLSEMNKTIIMVSHDMEFIARNFQRTIVMANKHKVFDGNTNELFTNKKLLQTAKLEMPALTRLTLALQWQEYITNVDDFISTLKNKVH